MTSREACVAPLIEANEALSSCTPEVEDVDEYVLRNVVYALRHRSLLIALVGPMF